MKKAKYIFLIITMLLVIGLFAFKPVKQKQKFLPTKLKITVIDGLGNLTEGAIVTIYNDEEDYRESENAIARDTTDIKGKVKFGELEPISYYIDARKGDMNNNGEGVKTAVLLEGKLNKVNTIID